MSITMLHHVHNTFHQTLEKALELGYINKIHAKALSVARLRRRRNYSIVGIRWLINWPVEKNIVILTLYAPAKVADL